MNYLSSGIIRIQEEKKLQNKPSKGRNQWNVLRNFDSKTVQEFITESERLTQLKPLDFQTGSWWNRELEWNLERNNIAIVAN